MAMPRTVLVLGARGFLGEHVVARLIADGYGVVAGVRPGVSHTFDSRVQVVEGDLTDAAWLDRVTRSVDAIIFSAGRTWQPGLPLDAYHRDNITITEKFFEAVRGRPQMRVVFTSSLSCVGGSDGPIIFGEDTGRSGIHEDWLTPYDRAKIACEEIALKAARSGNAVVVLNPGLMLGPGANAQSNLAAPFALLWHCQGQGSAGVYVNGGSALCDVRDVATAHVVALGQGRAGERYILGGHNLDRRAFYARVARLTGLKPPRRMPVWLVYYLMVLVNGVTFATRGLVPSPVHRSFVRNQGLYYFGNSDKAASELGYQVRPIEATILDMLRDYHSRGLVPRELDFFGKLTLDNASTYVLLRQLARDNTNAGFLLRRLPELYEICSTNVDLNRALQVLLAQSKFDERRGRFHWDQSSRDRLRYFRRLFDYTFFSSHEFLRQVS